MKKFYTFSGVRGNTVLLRYVDENGVRRTEKRDYHPTIFVPGDGGYKSIEGQPLATLQPGNIKETRDYIESYKDVHGYKIYGDKRFEYTYLTENFPDREFNPDFIKGHLIDIEVYTPTDSDIGFPSSKEVPSEIVLIQLYDTQLKKMLVLGTHPEQTWREGVLEHPVDVIYKQFNSERELLEAYVLFHANNYPDYMSAWNGEQFDFPYIVNRVEKVLGTSWMKKLSPFGVITRRDVKTAWGEFESVDIKGVALLDYMLLYKKHTFVTQESYALDHIAFVELGDRKLEYSGDINALYENDYQKYTDYGIKDTDLIRRLDEKLQLFNITFSLAYIAKCNYIDTLGTVKIWEILIYNYLYKQGIVPTIERTKGEKSQSFAGAFVKEPVPGKYKWVVSCDLNSLYPHLIQQYNLGPDTILPEARQAVEQKDLLEKKVDVPSKAGDNIFTANGYQFRRDKMSFSSEIMRWLYSERKQAKKKMLALEQEQVNATSEEEKLTLGNQITALDNLQMAYKILLNGGYGAYGNAAFKYFMLEVAEAITLGGQLSIKWIAQKSNEYLNEILGTDGKDYVAAIDTDSVYLVMDDFVTKFIPSTDELDIVAKLDMVFDKKIVPKMSEWYQELADYMQAYENRMFMAREVISPNSIWVAKKRYTMEVWNSEGVQYDKPKLKVMGLEAVRSTTPAFIKVALKECYQLALRKDNDELADYVTEFKKKYMSMPIKDIALPSGVNGVEEYYDPATDGHKKGAQAHVKAALYHNKLVRDLGLRTIAQIKSGDKLKYVYLKMPNPAGSEVVGFQNDWLPPEFDVENYLDKEVMFQKAFITPLQNFLDSMGWSTEKVVDLTSFFG